MVDCKEIDLMPIGIKNYMRTIKKVSLCVAIGTFALIFVMWVAGFFHDPETGIKFSSALLLIVIPLQVPGFMFEKVSQSKVYFGDDSIRILDKRGTCWRSIDYNSITAVHEKEIWGFFYGSNKDMWRNKYVCIFLNGLTTIPNVSFAKLFAEKDYIMFGYNAEALHWVYQKSPHLGGVKQEE